MDLHLLLELSPAWFTLQLLSPSEGWEEEIPIFEICPENRKSVFFEEGSGYFEMHIMLVLLHIKRIFVHGQGGRLGGWISILCNNGPDK